MKDIKRGDIYWTELSPVVGSEQYGYRPTLIIQNDIGNRFSNTVIVAVITKVFKKDLPTHVKLNKSDYPLEYDSVITLEQIRTIDKKRIGDWITSLDSDLLEEVDNKLKISLGINDDAITLVRASE